MQEEGARSLHFYGREMVYAERSMKKIEKLKKKLYKCNFCFSFLSLHCMSIYMSNILPITFRSMCSPVMSWQEIYFLYAA